MSQIFVPDFGFYKNLPDKRLLFNPLTDVDSFHREDDELIEFYKLGNEFYSPEFGIKYLLNINLIPYQMAIVRAILAHKFPLLLLTRGGAKTFLLAVTSVYMAIMNPGIKIILISASFRQSKFIFSEIKKIFDNSPLLRLVADSDPVTSVDKCYFKVNGSTITALPLGQGDKIRGERANVTFVDEFDSIPIEIFDVVVRGFSAVEADPWQKVKTSAMARLGQIKQQAESIFSTGNKIILSGTAGFVNGTFYRIFKQYSNILNNKILGHGRDFADILGIDAELYDQVDYRDYCVVRFNYLELPQGYLDIQMINNAKSSMPEMLFNMEYMTIFGDDTRGFFKYRDIQEATSKAPGGFSVKMVGAPSRQYVMGVDPARTNDRFSISLIELGSPNKLVYVWAASQKKYVEATKQLRHLLRKFNVVGIAMDAGGGGLAVEEYLQLQELMQTGDKKIYRFDDENMASSNGDKILYMFDFSSDWIEEANTLLQKSIEDKTLMFPMEIQIGDPIEEVEDIITQVKETKRELVCIEITYTKTGKKHFDLMPADTRKVSEEVPRHKDRYSSLLLANYLSARMAKINTGSDQDIINVYNQSSTIGGFIEQFGY